MKHKDLTFYELWDKEESQGLLSRLRSEYPLWQRHRRQRMITVSAVVVMAIVGTSIFNYHFSIPKGYDAVCCNRSSFSDNHWVNVASNILTIETL